MNNIVTASASGQEKTSSVITPTAGNASRDGFNTMASGETKDDIESFQQALQKNHDDLAFNERKNDDDISGNNMPLSERMPELPAQDDHGSHTLKVNLDDNLSVNVNVKTANAQVLDTQTVNTNIVDTRADNTLADKAHSNVLQTVHARVGNAHNLASQAVSLQTDNQLSADPTESLPKIKATGQGVTITPQMVSLTSKVDMKNSEKLNQLLAASPTGEEVDIDGELSKLPTQMHTMLKMEAGSAKKIVQPVSNGQVTTNIDPVRLALEPALVQSTDTLSLNAEPMDLMSQSVTNTTSQQHMPSNISASLISQIASAQRATAKADTTTDGLPSVTNLSSINLPIANSQTIPQALIAESFGRPEWSQGMGKQILWMVNQNIGSAQIRLNPAHLGPIEILIDMSEDQVNVSLSSRHAVVREAMEQALPRLREMLDDNGFNLADADISKHSFAEQREQEASDDKRNIAGDRSDEFVASDVSEKVMREVSLDTGVIDYYI